MPPRRQRIITPEREELLRDYFRRGYTAREIHSFLRKADIHISYSHLRCRVMPELGLTKRRNNRPGPLAVLDAVREVTNEGSNVDASTSAVTRAIRVDRQLNAIRSDVAAAQQLLAPERVAARRTGRLHRRTYYSEGKDYLWHIDGYDKLSPFGMPIHGCVDGFSRRVIWLELGTTNRRPEQTCSYFLDAVSKLGLPHSIRVDAGTENRNIKIAQDYLSTGLPRLTPLNAVLVGSSNHNERIERFWGLLRLQKINFWINHFKEFVRTGSIIAWDEVDRHVAYFVFHHLVRRELDRMAGWHNDHRIRRQPNPDIITGKPLHIHTCPEDYGRLDCTRTPPEIKIDVARVRLANNIDFPEDLRDTFNEIVEQAGMVYPPPDLDAADAMYLHLRAEAHAQLD